MKERGLGLVVREVILILYNPLTGASLYPTEILSQWLILQALEGLCCNWLFIDRNS